MIKTPSSWQLLPSYLQNHNNLIIVIPIFVLAVVIGSFILISAVKRSTPPSATTTAKENGTAIAIATKITASAPTIAPTATIPPTNTPLPVAVPVISITSMMVNAVPENIPGGRNALSLETLFKLTATDIDQQYTLELSTLIPPGLDFSTGDYDITSTALNNQVLITQKVPLNQVSLDKIIIKSHYVVEPVNQRTQSYPFTLMARVMKGMNELVRKETSTTTTISFQSGLVVNSVVSPTLVAKNETVTFTVTLTNSGQTEVTSLTPRFDLSNIPSGLGRTNEVGSQLAQLQLKPGESLTFPFTLLVLTANPRVVTPTLVLADQLNNQVVVSGTLQIYAQGTTTNNANVDHPLFEGPYPFDYKEIAQIPFSTTIKILDATLNIEKFVWYYVEVDLAGEVKRGWIWADRVKVDPEIKVQLEKKARSEGN